MIQGTSKIRNEKEYRALPLDSASTLKDFAEDRKKYYRKYILLESVEEEETQSSLMGRLVDTLLLEREKFNDRFTLSACIKAPSGMMLDFVNALCNITIECLDEEGKVTRSFEDRSKDAYIKSGYSIAYERVLKNFEGGDAEIYYNEILNSRVKGLSIVTAMDIDNAEKVVDNLRTNFVTSEIVNTVDSARYTVKNQLQVENFEIDGFPLKGMMDKMITDHFQHKIYVYDLKCVWSVENFYHEYYLKRKAYIQAYVYYRAAMKIANSLKEETSIHYDVEPPIFLVCDSINYYNPLLYKLSEADLSDAYEGFEYKGRQYPGVKTIIEELKFSLENNIWNISRENYLSNGVVKLKK